MKHICGYGCGKVAKYPPRKGMTKWCCEEYYSKCPNIKKANSETNKKVWADENSVFNSKEYREKQRKSSIGRPPWNKGKTKKDDVRVKRQSESLKNCWIDKDSYLNSIKYRNNLKISQNRLDVKFKKSISKKLPLEDINKKYLFFSKIEEMRYNPDKPEEKEIQVHCKNHNCPNSKEQGGWFTPTYSQFYERIRQIEKNGNDHCCFYCSKECKLQCPLYNLKSDPFKDISNPYTHEEYNTWKEIILKQDNYECQRCGSKANLHCHHIIPVKLEPLFALDPDNGIVLCENCHYKYGHKTGTECSTGNLSNKKCH